MELIDNDGLVDFRSFKETKQDQKQHHRRPCSEEEV